MKVKAKLPEVVWPKNWPKNWNVNPLVIFDSHPIQYRSPVFANLASRGAPVRVFYFNEGFDGKKWWFHEVGKIPDQKWEIALRDGFANAVLGTHSLSLSATYRKLRETLILEQPVAVLIFGYYLAEHWMIWWLAQELRIPVLFVGETFRHGGSSTRKFMKAILQPFFFRGINQFIAIGEKTKEFYTSFKIDAHRIISAKYCVDTSFFSMNEKDALTDRNAMRLQLGIPEDAFVILFVGRLFGRKRPQDMIALHKTLSDSRVYTIIVGNGEMESSLKDETASIANIRMVGFKNQAETRAFYHTSDCLVVPSEYETWGLVANEALACGIPAIVTDQCGVAGDLIVDGETGFTVPVGDISTLTDRLRKLKNNQELRKKMGLQGSEKVHSLYSVEQFADAVLEAVSRTHDSAEEQV
jgi:glycosyltransferase involved in cell wall biosynthesis